VLQEVRTSGYATEMEELAMGRACVAAPVRGSLGTVIAAISLSGPERIMNLVARESDLAAQVVDAALRISERLGFSTADIAFSPGSATFP
jgi:DNA-binding IclR family transcriptional regulator